MPGVPMQSRFPYLWLAAQKMIGGTRDKSALVLRHYSNQRRIIEIGCSLGNLSDAYRELDGISYTGIDIDNSAIAIARQRFASQKNFQFEAVPVEEMARRGKPYDYVVIAGILHHVDDRTAIGIIESSWKITAQGGVLIASEPEALRPADNAIFRLFYRLEEGRFLRSRRQLAGLFEAAGVPVTSLEDHLVSPGVVTWPAVARFNLVRADRAAT
ncbi:class I SAM-dependent methyltransferase [Bradyrhizobium sp. A5]|uniref:class I SAM-dependent methyltransferase n=1 Tax=Bradyrhizobium sp. A5 TaxID=3133696 RepID=UPI0032567E6C